MDQKRERVAGVRRNPFLIRNPEALTDDDLRDHVAICRGLIEVRRRESDFRARSGHDWSHTRGATHFGVLDQVEEALVALQGEALRRGMEPAE